MTGDAPQWLVACLCAQWCGSCRDYRPVFDSQAKAHGASARFQWVDIEDHPEVLGLVEIENFPTLLIARGDEIAFFGPIAPRASTLSRLVQSALAGELSPVIDPELANVPSRIRRLPP